MPLSRLNRTYNDLLVFKNVKKHLYQSNLSVLILRHFSLNVLFNFSSCCYVLYLSIPQNFQPSNNFLKESTTAPSGRFRVLGFSFSVSFISLCSFSMCQNNAVYCRTDKVKRQYLSRKKNQYWHHLLIIITVWMGDLSMVPLSQYTQSWLFIFVCMCHEGMLGPRNNNIFNVNSLDKQL